MSVSGLSFLSIVFSSKHSEAMYQSKYSLFVRLILEPAQGEVKTQNLVVFTGSSENTIALALTMAGPLAMVFFSAGVGCLRREGSGRATQTRVRRLLWAAG